LATVRFRDMAADDVAAGLRLCRANNWNQTEADWRVLLEKPSVFRVAALPDGRVVGTAGAIGYGRELAWVCMVLVDAAERGHGLGSALVAQVLERLGSFESVGLDATPKGRPVYARLGFADAYGLVRAAAGVSVEKPTSAVEARPMTEADLEGVLAWDREVFEADRARVLRRAFDAAPEQARVVAAEGALDGYCFGRRGHHSDSIGPVVARSREAARALVGAGLRSGAERRVIVDAVAAPEWRADLEALGFREERGLTRMYLGGRRPAETREPLWAVFGPEFG
jgi:GNAT superfamily N-acetyltransferase